MSRLESLINLTYLPKHITFLVNLHSKMLKINSSWTRYMTSRLNTPSVALFLNQNLDAFYESPQKLGDLYLCVSIQIRRLILNLFFSYPYLVYRGFSCFLNKLSPLFKTSKGNLLFARISFALCFVFMLTFHIALNLDLKNSTVGAFYVFHTLCSVGPILLAYDEMVKKHLPAKKERPKSRVLQKVKNYFNQDLKEND